MLQGLTVSYGKPLAVSISLHRIAQKVECGNSIVSRSEKLWQNSFVEQLQSPGSITIVSHPVPALPRILFTLNWMEPNRLRRHQREKVGQMQYAASRRKGMALHQSQSASQWHAFGSWRTSQNHLRGRYIEFMSDFCSRLVPVLQAETRNTRGS